MLRPFIVKVSVLGYFPLVGFNNMYVLSLFFTCNEKCIVIVCGREFYIKYAEFAFIFLANPTYV